MTTNDAAPLNVERVIADEYDFLHPSQDGARDGPAPSSPAELLRRHAAAGHSALCLSGGGVRSASFGLGVLQGFARAGQRGVPGNDAGIARELEDGLIGHGEIEGLVLAAQPVYQIGQGDDLGRRQYFIAGAVEAFA